MDVASTFFLGQESIRRAPAPAPSATAGAKSAVSRNASVPPPRTASSFASARTGTLQSRFEKLVYASPMPLSILKYYSSTQTAHVPGPADTQSTKRSDIPTIQSTVAAPVARQNIENKETNNTKKENTPEIATTGRNAPQSQIRPPSSGGYKPAEDEVAVPKAPAISSTSPPLPASETTSMPPPLLQPPPISTLDDVESPPLPALDKTVEDVRDESENANLIIDISELEEDVPAIQESIQENDQPQPPPSKRKGRRISAPSPVSVAEKPLKRKAQDAPPPPAKPTTKRQRKSLDIPAKSGQDSRSEDEQPKKPLTSIPKKVISDNGIRSKRGRKSAPAAIESTVEEPEPTVLPRKQAAKRSSTQLKTPAKSSTITPATALSQKKPTSKSAPPAQKVERRGRPPLRAGAPAKTPSKAVAHQRTPKSTQLSHRNEVPNNATKAVSKTPPAKQGGVSSLRKSSRRHSAPRDYWVIGSEPRSPIYRETELKKRSFL